MPIREAQVQTVRQMPVKKRIDFKILSLVHKCLYGEAPEYLKNLLIIQDGGRDGLWSATDSMKTNNTKDTVHNLCWQII